MFQNTLATHIGFLFLRKGDINSSYKYFMYMLGLRTQWRAGTDSTCRTQPFVRFSYHATERVHRGRFLPRRSSRAPARLTQQYQSFPPARRVIQGRQLVGRQLHQGFQIRDEVESCGRESKAPLQGFCCVCSLLTRFYRQWSTAVAHDVCLEHMTDGRETLEEVLAESDMII